MNETTADTTNVNAREAYIEQLLAEKREDDAALDDARDALALACVERDEALKLGDHLATERNSAFAARDQAQAQLDRVRSQRPVKDGQAELFKDGGGDEISALNTAISVVREELHSHILGDEEDSRRLPEDLDTVKGIRAALRRYKADEELTFKETGDRIGISPTTIRVFLDASVRSTGRILRTIRAFIEEQGEGE